MYITFNPQRRVRFLMPKFLTNRMKYRNCEGGRKELCLRGLNYLSSVL